MRCSNNSSSVCQTERASSVSVCQHSSWNNTANTVTVSTVLRGMENTPVLVQLDFTDQHTNNNQVHKHFEHVSLLLLSLSNS